MLSSSKVLFFEGFDPPPRRPSNLVKIVSHTISYIEFQLSMSSCSKWSFYGPTFWWGAVCCGPSKKHYTNNPCRSFFSLTLRFLH